LLNILIHKTYNNDKEKSTNNALLDSPVMLFKEIMRQQNYLKARLWQMSDDLGELKNIVIQGKQNITNVDIESSIFKCLKLPLKTEKDLEEIAEQFLLQTDHFEISVSKFSY